MLTQLRIQNFKSWRDTGQMRFAPLTGFFGPNSSGKTSILQFLLMLKQTVLSTDYTQVLNLGHERTYVDLGAFSDIIFKYKHPGHLNFEFEFLHTEPLRQQSLPFDSLMQELILSERLNFTGSIREDFQRNIFLDNFSYKAAHHNFTMQYCENLDSHDLEPSESNYCLQINLPTESYLQKVASPFKFYGFPSSPINEYSFSLEYLVRELEGFISQLGYLGPLREYPRRNYLWRGSKISDLGMTGEYTVQALLSSSFDRNLDKPSIEQQVAYWFKRLGLIESFALRPIAENRRDYELRVRQTPSSPEVLITEVGFGVSQILPVLTLCYYVPEGSTIILEQPEIHLHPAVQAGLADVFIDVIKNRGIQIILESHSEHLLYRLQRRMAEEKLVPEDVALYFTHMESGESKLDELKLDEYGNINNWPDNFFGDRMDDLVAMAEAAMKRQGVNGVNEP